ncbi:hypothetical protein [Lysinibacillus xylanilyticus]|nr:hypothetical protein [Lysinibacillus xylanilyticus]
MKFSRARNEMFNPPISEDDDGVSSSSLFFFNLMEDLMQQEFITYTK